MLYNAAYDYWKEIVRIAMFSTECGFYYIAKEHPHSYLRNRSMSITTKRNRYNLFLRPEENTLSLERWDNQGYLIFKAEETETTFVTGLLRDLMHDLHNELGHLPYYTLPHKEEIEFLDNLVQHLDTNSDYQISFNKEFIGTTTDMAFDVKFTISSKPEVFMHIQIYPGDDYGFTIEWDDGHGSDDVEIVTIKFNEIVDGTSHDPYTYLTDWMKRVH